VVNELTKIKLKNAIKEYKKLKKIGVNNE